MKTLKTILILIFFSCYSFLAKAQYHFSYPAKSASEVSDDDRERIMSSVKELLVKIENKADYDDFLKSDNIEVSRNYFKYLGNTLRLDTIAKYFRPQLLNLYKLTGGQEYYVTIACYLPNNDKSLPPIIYGIYSFIACQEENRMVFTSPIKVRTKAWKTKTIGEITFCYPNELNIERANLFVEKNRKMAKRMNLPLESYSVYVTNNYQEVLFLQGIDYSYPNNGTVNLGDIVGSKVIFSTMGNEDFSHDALHVYARKVRDKMNVTAEEGLAYTWGDAYYADSNGYIPSQKDLIQELNRYIQSHPDKSLLDIFTQNPRIFEYSKKISPKSAISGAICDEIERIKGTEGIIELLQCGSGDDSYFESIDKLLGINKDNFNEKVLPLLKK